MADWVGREILVHERDLRLWLRGRVMTAEDVEDVVQECYCCLAQLDSVAHIVSPRAYFFTMARNIAYKKRNSARVVRIDSFTDREMQELESDLPLPERIAAARQELDRVHAAIASLSERAQRIFVMRRVEGLSQKEIAAALNVSETIVENDASRSLRAILAKLADVAPVDPAQHKEHGNARRR